MRFRCSDAWRPQRGFAAAACERGLEVADPELAHVPGRIPAECHIENAVVLSIRIVNGVEHQRAILRRAAQRTDGVRRRGQRYSTVFDCRLTAVRRLRPSPK